MKWLKKKFKQWSIEAWNSAQVERDEVEPRYGQAISSSKVYSTRSIETSSLNFTLYPATGGHVLEMTMNDYNPSSLQVNYPRKVLHIIPSGEDLGDALGKIITLELLKQ
jgi:hypothetical protein